MPRWESALGTNPRLEKALGLLGMQRKELTEKLAKVTKNTEDLVLFGLEEGYSKVELAKLGGISLRLTFKIVDRRKAKAKRERKLNV